LYQGIQPGGQLTITTEVENYPGYPDGIQGPEMMVHFEKQAARMGADIRYGLATAVDFSGHPLKVQIDEEKWMEANSVIICTGASAKWLGLPSEQRLNGHGVSACAVCDGFFFKGKEVAIVGAGDTACEEALYLSKLCTTVHMIIRRDQMRASKIMQDRVEVERAGKIEVLKLDDFGGGDGGPGGGISSNGDDFVVDEAELDKGLENLPMLLTQARAVPYFKEGRSIGLRLFAIKTGSLYEKIGLKNGDILKSINGHSLGAISQALKLLSQIHRNSTKNHS
jgi:hypothetical protein